MTKPSSLPEKEWFTLEEIAERWGTTSKTVLHYGGGGLLEICAYWVYSIKGVYAIGQHSVRREPEEILHPTGYPPKENLCALFVLTWSELTFMEQIGVSESDLAHLYVTRFERDGFEQEHRVGAHAGAMPKGPEDTRERRALLNIIGALVELIESPRPNRETDAGVIAELRENWPEKYGMSEGNLKKKFAEARRSLREDE